MIATTRADPVALPQEHQPLCTFMCTLNMARYAPPSASASGTTTLADLAPIAVIVCPRSPNAGRKSDGWLNSELVREDKFDPQERHCLQENSHAPGEVIHIGYNLFWSGATLARVIPDYLRTLFEYK